MCLIHHSASEIHTVEFTLALKGKNVLPDSLGHDQVGIYIMQKTRHRDIYNKF